ncbi:MAG: hypothetical protein ABL951_09780 [Alphaproteobacteria bacterium]
MSVWSRRRSARRVGSKSLISGLATALGTIGAFALGVTVVMPNFSPGPADQIAADYIAAEDGQSGTGGGSLAGLPDSEALGSDGANGSLSIPEGSGFAPGLDSGPGTDQTDALPGNASTDAGENTGGDIYASLSSDDDGAGETPGSGFSGGFGNGAGRGLTFGRNAPLNANIQNDDGNTADLEETFPDQPPFTGAFDPAGPSGDNPDILADMGFPDPGDPQPDGPGPVSQGGLPVVFAANFTPPAFGPEGQQINPDSDDSPGIAETPGPGPSFPGGGPDLPDDGTGQEDNAPPDQGQQLRTGPTATDIPEPETLGMMVLAMLGLWRIRPSRRAV